MESWLTIIGDHGMTAAIAFYLLHRSEKKLDLLIQVVQTGHTFSYSKGTSASKETSSPSRFSS